jgi:hypothetical protein
LSSSPKPAPDGTTTLTFHEVSVPRICFVLIAGLDTALLSRNDALPTLSALPHKTVYEPAFPAVTCTAQATLSTGVRPDQHGILCNGLYTHGILKLHSHLDLSNHADARTRVSFWEQGNSLLQMPRFWDGLGKKTAMLFWQQSMPGLADKPAADIVLTPKPEHTPEGKTLTACWSAPRDLYSRLSNELGPFPLHHYWSPMAGLPSSDWILKAAERVWKREKPDLQLVYVPHLDFNLQRLGPGNPAVVKDLADVDALLAPLAATVRATGGTLVVAGDYGMYDVTTPVLPNLALRRAGLLATAADADGKLVIDYDASAAFVMADHQVAFLYAKEGRADDALRVLTGLPGVERALSSREDLERVGLASERTGNVVLLASPTAWFAHDWWESDEEKPRWQFSVDIHNKPGFDPRELFLDRARKCIAQDPALVKGSHGLTDDPTRWPVLLSDAPLPTTGGIEGMRATAVAGWLKTLITSA